MPHSLFAVLASLDEIKETLASLSISHVSADMSKASKTLQQAALKHRRLCLRVVRATELEQFVEIETQAFMGWGSRSEEEATPDIRDYFEAHFRLPPNTHVEHVHSAEALLSADVPGVDPHSHAVVTHFKGKTDLVVVDSPHVRRGDPESALTGALCLVEIKRRDALRDKRAACRAQAMLELLGIEAHSGYAVPVVLSNFQEPSDEESERGSGIQIFSRKGRIIRDFVGAHGGPLRLSEANGILALLLPTVLADRARTDAALLAALSEGDDDDDDSGGGAEFDEEEGPDVGSSSGFPVISQSGLLSSLRRSSRVAAQTQATSCGDTSSTVCNLTNPLTLSCEQARMFAAVQAEDRARRIRVLVGQSPQILQVLRHISDNAGVHVS